jgi:flagellar biosynthesis protein FliR
MEKHASFFGAVAAICTAWLFLYSLQVLDDFHLREIWPFAPTDFFQASVRVYIAGAAAIAAWYGVTIVLQKRAVTLAGWLAFTVILVGLCASAYLLLYGETHIFEWQSTQLAAAFTIAGAGLGATVLLAADTIFRDGGPLYSDKPLGHRLSRLLMFELLPVSWTPS